MSDTANVTVQDLEVHADSFDAKKAAAIYKEHGALVVRGMMRDYIADIKTAIDHAAKQAIELIEDGQGETVEGIGYRTPDGTLWLPAPQDYPRDWQIMVLRVGYSNCGAFMRSALHAQTIDLAVEVLGPNVELYHGGQCLYKEPVGGHPKELHQDAAYFEHKYEGPLGMLNYVVDTPVERGALHVIPGSHRMGVLEHVDTFSHLGLDPNKWTWEQATPIEGAAGDAIFFHVNTIHGSKPNYTDIARPVFIHRYRRSDDFAVVTGPTAAARKLSEAAKEEAIAKAKKENEFGLMVAGFRPMDAERQANM